MRKAPTSASVDRRILLQRLLPEARHLLRLLRRPPGRSPARYLCFWTHYLNFLALGEGNRPTLAPSSSMSSFRWIPALKLVDSGPPVPDHLGLLPNGYPLSSVACSRQRHPWSWAASPGTRCFRRPRHLRWAYPGGAVARGSPVNVSAFCAVKEIICDL